MLREFAQRLMTLDRSAVSEGLQPSVIFGTTDQLSRFLDLDRPDTRIAVYPIVSSTAPVLAMGLATVLAGLLDGWKNVRVYRLFVKLPETLSNFDWTIETSQFTPEDFQVDDLDHNVTVWGTLTQEGERWKLKITVEEDWDDENEQGGELDLMGDSVVEILQGLPALAGEIALTVGIKERSAAHPIYSLASAVATAPLENLVGAAFDWECKLVLTLYGWEWHGEALEALHSQLIQVGKQVDDLNSTSSLGVWCVATATARGMLPGFSFSNQRLVSHIDDVLNGFSNRIIPSLLLGSALYAVGNTQDAYELLETAVSDFPSEDTLWLSLAMLYWNGGGYSKAIDAYQRAIEEDATSAALYMSYAKHLTMLVNAQEELKEFILIDPDEIDEQRTTWEAVEAYEEAISLSETPIEALFRQVALLLRLEDGDRLWSAFEELVATDPTGDYIRSIVDTLYAVDDLYEPIKILEEALQQNTDRIDLMISLGNVYVMNEQFSEAKTLFTEVEKRTDEPDVLADVQRGLLLVSVPNFEMRVREVADIIDAGNDISSNQFEFLEDLVARAPKFVDAYLLLARAYLAANEADTALEILLDAQNNVEDDANILELLAWVLWDADEPQIAFEYLRRGIAKYPNHVPLLARAGVYLFEFGELDNARGYLARAEAINPRDPALGRARVAVAQMITRNSTKAAENDED